MYFYKYSSNPVLSVFFFITIGYFSCSMNFIRQSIAGAIFLFAIECVRKKKLIPYIILTLIAATFHVSALFMLPFYFILQIKITKRVLLIYSAITAVLFATSNFYIELAIKYVFPWYPMEDYFHIGSGIDWFYAIMPIAIFIIFFLYSKIFTKFDESNYVYLSCTFFTAFICIIALKHSILDRFLLYFEPISVVSIPLLFSKLKDSALCDGYAASHFSADVISQNVKRNSFFKSAVPASIIVMSLLYNGIVLYIDSPCVVPYKVIFNQPFYADYVASLKSKGKSTIPTEGLPIDPAQPLKGEAFILKEE